MYLTLCFSKLRHKLAVSLICYTSVILNRMNNSSKLQSKTDCTSLFGIVLIFKSVVMKQKQLCLKFLTAFVEAIPIIKMSHNKYLMGWFDIFARWALSGLKQFVIFPVSDTLDMNITLTESLAMTTTIIQLTANCKQHQQCCYQSLTTTMITQLVAISNNNDNTDHY